MSQQELTILLIEDSEHDVESVKRALDRDPSTKYNLLHSSSWSESLEIFASASPDAVLLDYNLPGFTGVELLYELVARHPRENLACVLLTGGGDEALVAEAMKAGARDYLAKTDISTESLRLAVRGSIQQQTHEKELAQKQTALEAALQHANEVSEAKSAFLTNMSHEIRTPLNGILGFIELTQEKVEDEESRSQLGYAYQAAIHLAELVTDVLDLSKIETGKLLLNEEQFTISEVLSLSADFVEPLLKEKALTLDINIAKEIPTGLLGDGLRLRQIIINLLSNAIKHSSREDSIKISANLTSSDQDLHYVLLQVADSGIGIPLDKRHLVFESFTQLENTTGHQQQGTGLGLTIAAKLVEIMGGKLELNSNEGQGSIFSFTIPFTSRISSTPISDREYSSTSIQSRSLEILVAEDDRVNQRLLKALLEKHSHKVTFVENGEDAVVQAATRRFDILIMDIRMPLMNGYEATQLIRQEEEEKSLPPLPIFALTANAFESDRKKCVDVGMTDYLSKPYTAKALLGVIDRLVPYEAH